MEKRGPHKVKCDYGVPDYYKQYKKDYSKKLTKGEYNNILSDVLDGLGKAVVTDSYMLRFPYRLGVLLLLKYKTKTSFKDGKMITNRPVDIAATVKLWKENPKAKEEGKKIYYQNFHTDGHVFRVSYLKKTAYFRNKSTYWMQLNRDKKRLLAKNIKSGKVDALLKE